VSCPRGDATGGWSFRGAWSMGAVPWAVVVGNNDARSAVAGRRRSPTQDNQLLRHKPPHCTRIAHGRPHHHELAVLVAPDTLSNAHRHCSPSANNHHQTVSHVRCACPGPRRLVFPTRLCARYPESARLAHSHRRAQRLGQLADCVSRSAGKQAPSCPCSQTDSAVWQPTKHPALSRNHG
jgi:hypothetical protein